MGKVNNGNMEELLALCELVMKGTEGPLHYKTLHEVLADSGAFDFSVYKRPTDSLYCMLQSDIRKGANRFRFMGGGVFVWAGLIDTPEAQALVIKPTDKPRPAPLPMHEAGSAMCGDCGFARYSGIQVTLRRTADCGATGSEHDFVHNTTPSCALFRRKSDAVMRREYEESLNDKAIIFKINTQIAKMSGRSA